MKYGILMRQVQNYLRIILKKNLYKKLKKHITHVDFNEISNKYTKIDGNDNDFSDVNEIWKEKNILCSPKIIYE